MKAFADYQRTLAETAQGHDSIDVDAIDGSKIPLYGALGLAGETGEVIELVKKAARGRTPIDRAKIGLELGDVLWYVTRLADRVGLTLAQVAMLSDMKLRRRNLHGKDEKAELELARVHVRGFDEGEE